MPFVVSPSRRWVLRAGIGGIAGLFASQFAGAGMGSEKPVQANKNKSVILFWLSGGPSQIDTWDPKPDAPVEIRGPYGTIATKVPGLRLSEHLPLQASIADKLSFLRAVDCKASDHTPITMQAGNPLARRTNDGNDGGGWPSMGSIAAKFRGANHPDMPAFVGLAPSWVADVYESGDLGKKYAPAKGLELSGKFDLPQGMQPSRLGDRRSLLSGLDRLNNAHDHAGELARLEYHHRQAYEMVLGGHVKKAFDISGESESTRDLYGRDEIGSKALLARRLVEAGTTFVVVSGAWGYFDHHGDHVNWGGIVKGLTPLLPRIDRALYGLVTDLDQRGILDDTLVLMMGEFGRSPIINKEAGREHWLQVMSAVMAGGKFRHGQAIGSTDGHGGEIRSGAVRPQDLAATIYKHLEIPLDAHWQDPKGRPTPIVVEGGRPIPELG